MILNLLSQKNFLYNKITLVGPSRSPRNLIFGYIAPMDKTQIRSRYSALPTAVIADVYDENGWEVTALDYRITRKTQPVQRVAGFAATLEGALSSETGGDTWKLEIVDNLPEHAVAVWAGTNADGFCLFGDLIASTMKKRGVAGAIVDGGFRDVAEISHMEFPVFARYVSPVQSIGRWRITKANTPVHITGATGGYVTVHPGDFVLGDEDGVMVIQQARIMEVLERAEAIVAQEAEQRKAAEEGMSAAEMLEKFGHV